MKYLFKQDHPNANISKFVFDVGFAWQWKKCYRKIHWVQASETQEWDITSDVFKKYSDIVLDWIVFESLYFNPHIWSTRKTIQKLSVRKNLPFDITNFEIYVNNTDYFTSNFSALNTKWAIGLTQKKRKRHCKSCLW